MADDIASVEVTDSLTGSTSKTFIKTPFISIKNAKLCELTQVENYRPVTAGKHRKLAGIHRGKSKKFPVGILLPLPAISGAFLQDPAGFSDRNLRLGHN